MDGRARIGPYIDWGKGISALQIAAKAVAYTEAAALKKAFAGEQELALVDIRKQGLQSLQ